MCVMTTRGRSAGKRQKKQQQEQPQASLTCAVCGRKYRTLAAPSADTIYSICSDCRLSEPPLVK
jgi:hypothetical protein